MSLFGRSDYSKKLYEEAGNGNTRGVLKNFGKGGDVNWQTELRETPLHAAAARGHVHTVTALLQNGADVDAVTLDGLTPLHLAVYHRHQDTILGLVHGRANVEKATPEGLTVLHLAACDAETTQTLLDNGAINIINAKGAQGMTALHEAVSARSDGVISLLLSKGADVDAHDGVGSTPLHQAVLVNSLRIVDILLAHKADWTVANTYGETALHVAAANGYVEVVGRLLGEVSIPAKGWASPPASASASPESTQSELVQFGSPLHFAAQAGHATVIAPLVKHFPVNEQNSDGNTPLHLAILGNNSRTAQMLLRHNADPFQCNGEGKRPRQLCLPQRACAALLQREVDQLREAVKAGKESAFLESTTGWRDWQSEVDGKSLLHVAAEERPVKDLVKIIALAPKLLQLCDAHGCTVLHQLTRFGTSEAVSRLLEELALGSTADLARLVNATTKTGRTALHDAAALGDVSTIRALLRTGVADVDAHDADGKSPVLVAVEQGHEDAVSLLMTDGDASLDHDVFMRENSVCDEMMSTLIQLDLSQWTHRLVSAWARQHPARSLIFQIACGSSSHDGIAVTWAVGAANYDAIQRVRTGDFCVATDNAFAGTLRDQHSDVYQALAYSCSDLCDPEDVQDALRRYEARVPQEFWEAHTLGNTNLNPYPLVSSITLDPGNRVAVLPLYFLAHSRLARLQGHRSMADFLCDFYRAYEHRLEDSWLTSDEKACGFSAQVHTPVRPGSSLSYESSSSHTVAGWVELRDKLTAEKRAPMEELLALTGLLSVKEKALEVYRDVLADNLLREHKHERAVVSQSLNFAFLGNPGTGKTTVARIFAKLLEVAGARRGHKLVQMTGSEALRMGARAFASALSSLTGDKQGIGPPPDELRLMLGVEVQCKADALWYPATILSMPAPHATQKAAYTVRYTDGTEEAAVSRERLRVLGTAGKGGILFIDEAYDLDPAKAAEGRAILAHIMSVAEDHRDTVTIILAGYKEEVEDKIFHFNPGLPSRFITVTFDDFTDVQLADIWKGLCHSTGCRVKDSVVQVVKRRLGRLRKREGFGNAREVRKIFEAALTQAKRRYFLKDQFREGGVCETEEAGVEIVVEDVMGHDPTRENMPGLDSALRELEAMTGLAQVKDAILQIVSMAHNNYHAELRGERVDHIPLNRLFLGNPGCGKTTVALLYGRILHLLGLLSLGEPLYRTASDFIGQAVGESQQKTVNTIRASQGKVLVIDEAYALNATTYGRQVLDTIVEKVSGGPGEGIAVVLVGYRNELTKMLRDGNPGLSRRFNVSSAFEFADFSDAELLDILTKLCRREEVRAPFDLKRRVIDDIARQRALAHFGNAGLVQTRLHDAVRAMRERVHRGGLSTRGRNELCDADFGIGTQRDDPLKALESLCDVGTFKKQLRDIGSAIRVRRQEGRPSTGLLQNYLFVGSAGTGKTTVARKVASVLYGYGLLPTDHLVTTSAKDLCAMYVGHTKDKVEEAMKTARGGVLFVDEAYLLGDDNFGQEAMTKLLTMMTEEGYQDNLVVILAGYRDPIDTMLQRNEGMKSRFTETVHFPDWTPTQCCDFVISSASAAQPPYTFEAGPVVKVPPSRVQQEVRKLLTGCFKMLACQPGWANARDAVRMMQDIERHRERRLGDPSSGNEAVGITLSDVKGACDAFIGSRRKKPFPLPENVAQQAAESYGLLAVPFIACAMLFL